MATIARCLMHEHEIDVDIYCKQCCMLLRKGVICRWLEGTDTDNLIKRTYKLERRKLNMFIYKDVKGKLEALPGDINKDDVAQTQAFVDRKIKIQDVEEIYKIYDIFKPKVKTITTMERVVIEGETLPGQAFVERAKTRVRRSKAQIEADAAAKAAEQE